MEQNMEKDNLRGNIGLACQYLTFLPILWILGVVFVENDAMPAGMTAAQWVWLGKAGIVACVYITAVAFLKPYWLLSLPYFLTWTMILIGGVEAVWGLFQAFGLCPSNHPLFLLTGSFYNPGPYSGYLTMILPIAFYEILKSRLIGLRPELYISTAAALLILCVLPAGMSRAAWLAAGASLLYVALMWWRKRFRLSRRKTAYGLTLLVVAACLVGGSLYLMKKDSADGRLLIWKITLKEALKHPLYGDNSGRTFSAVFGEAQENYFAAGNYTETEERVAGTPESAFNEFIQLFFEYGIIPTLVLLAAIVYLILYGGRMHEYGLSGALISACVFAFFSYPFHIPAFLPVLALIMVSLILIRVFSAGWKKTDLTELRMTVALIATAGILLSVLSYECNKSEANGIREWTKEARVLYRSGAYESAVRACKKIDGMDANPDYLFEYGRSLFKTGNYQEARRMFENALHYSGDPMILNLLGQTLWAQEDYSGAEECFRRAAHRLPGRIYPYYLLSKLYADSGYYHPDKLRETARVVLTKEPKVPSVAIGQMREEIKRIMEKENLKKCM